MLNEVLGVAARFQQHLTRKFGITGGAPSPQLTPEIAPVFQLEGGPEGHILQGEYLASGTIACAGVALKKSAVGLFNPVGSNIVLTLDWWEAMPFAAANLYGGIFKAASPYPGLQSPGESTYRDTRVPVDPGGSTATKLPAGLVRSDTDPPQLPTKNVIRENINGVIHIYRAGQDVVLAPGWAFAFYIDTVNTNLWAGFGWRETPLAQGEVGPF